MDALSGDHVVEVREIVERLGERRCERKKLRRDLDGVIEALDHPGRHGCDLIPGESPGRQDVGHTGVHSSGRHAEACGLCGEVAADFVGAQISLGVEVADACGGQRPSVGGGHQELLQHREACRLLFAVPIGPPTVQPAQQRGDILASRSGQRVVDLHVGIDAGDQPAEDLQQRGVAIGE